MYVLSINQTKQETDPEKLEEAVPLHINWTKEMISSGKMVQTGKWGENGGMAIWNVESLAEAERLETADPLTGLVDVERGQFYPNVKLS